MMQENGFRETEIGPIPSEWDVLNLSNEMVADLIMGQSPASSTYNQAGEGTPFMQGKAEFGSVYPNPNKWCTAPSRLAEKDDILISVRAPVGDVNISPFKCAIGRGLAAIRAKDKTMPLYLFFYLTFAKKRLEDEGTGSIFKAINKGVLENFKIALPEVGEQKNIVATLFQVLQAIEQQEKIIEKTKEFKRSLMHRLFTYGLRGEELKETEIGLMPESWEVFSISQKCLVKGSTMALTELPLLDTKNTQLELVHGIKVSDMNTVGNEKSINHANIVAYLSKQEAIKKTVPQGSIAFPKRGAAIATNKKRLTTSWTVLDPNLIAIIPNEDIDAEYLYYWFLIFDLRSIQDPGPTPQLNKKDVNPIRFPCPSIEEQKQISSFLSIIDSRHSLSEQKKNCLNELFKSMLQLLMTGQVRVKDVDFGEDCE